MDEKAKSTVAVFDELVGHLYNIWIEMEACADLAVGFGASRVGVELAKREALADPEIQKEARARFADMWNALKNAGLVLENEERFESLGPTDKPN